MKNLLLSLCMVASSIIMAQVPQAIKYQAVARDTNGSLLINQQISIRVSIIDSLQGGATMYREIHDIGTNQQGLFSINIGQGTNQLGQLANIPWSTGNKWLTIEMDPDGGFNYSFMGVQQLLSVPYALYAETSGNSTSSTSFNPLYPDGTDGIEGVTQYLTDSNFYVVPPGKNLHVVFFGLDSAASGPSAIVIINGITFYATSFASGYAAQSFVSFGDGDSISVAPSSPNYIMFGYLVDAKVTPVNVDLGNGTFVVPNGKQLFINRCTIPKDVQTPKIQVNGITLYTNFIPTLPIILKSGETISVTPLASNTYLNGYLK